MSYTILGKTEKTLPHLKKLNPTINDYAVLIVGALSHLF